MQQTYQAKPGNLPRPLTPFIGREQELADLGRMLTDPACRFITLIGPGGIGKTRLAVQAASALTSHFTDGVVFVNLQPVTSADFIITAIAAALDFPLSGLGEPVAQLAGYLSDKNVLLLVDNAEHVLPGMSILSDLLLETQHLKILVTSREALNLMGEWLYAVDGLPLPPDTPDTTEARGNLDAYSGIQLFIACARRMRPRFSLSDERERDGVLRICRLVEGMPLAIELAAAWVKTLSCADIAGELQRNLDLLTASARDIPERHRSMQAVFEQSWAMLTPQEQDVFKRLSVFRGGFRREAAEKVAGASLVTLTALVDKSLLRWDPAGRYQIHELLRQFGESQFAHMPNEVNHILDLHADYYAEFLHQRLPGTLGHRQREVVIEIEGELENVRAAWDWMVEQGNVEALDKSARTFAVYGQMRSRYFEVAQALEKAISKLDAIAATALTKDIDVALTPILCSLGWIYIRFGQYRDTEAVLQRSRAIYQRLGIPPVYGTGTDPALGLGLSASIRGDYDAAIRFANEALRTSEANGHAVNRAYAYSVLASAAQAKGEYQQAQRYAQQAYTLTQQTGDRWFAPQFLLGKAAMALGDYSAAKSHFASYLVIRKEFDDRGGMASALNHLGGIALREGNHAQAEQHYHQALDLYRDINDKGGRATSLKGLGQVALATGDDEGARRRMREALQIAREIEYAPLIFSTLVGIGELLLKTGKAERGFELLEFAQHHPACPSEAREQTRQVLARYQDCLPNDARDRAIKWATTRDLDAAVEIAQVELATLMLHEKMVEPTSNNKASQSTSTIELPVEPLTAREFEVLQLIADGLSNQDIANKLVISVGTVKFYTNQIYGKLGVNSRTQAVARARELKLLT